VSWVRALKDVVRETHPGVTVTGTTSRPQKAASETRTRARMNHGLGYRGHGLNFDQVVHQDGQRSNPDAAVEALVEALIEPMDRESRHRLVRTLSGC
jgi:hypothetical protein